MEGSVAAVDAAANRVLFSLRLGGNDITAIDLGLLAYVQHSKWKVGSLPRGQS